MLLLTKHHAVAGAKTIPRPVLSRLFCEHEGGKGLSGDARIALQPIPPRFRFPVYPFFPASANRTQAQFRTRMSQCLNQLTAPALQRTIRAQSACRGPDSSRERSYLFAFRRLRAASPSPEQGCGNQTALSGSHSTRGHRQAQAEQGVDAEGVRRPWSAAPASQGRRQPSSTRRLCAAQPESTEPHWRHLGRPRVHR